MEAQWTQALWPWVRTESLVFCLSHQLFSPSFSWAIQEHLFSCYYCYQDFSWTNFFCCSSCRLEYWLSCTRRSGGGGCKLLLKMSLPWCTSQELNREHDLQFAEYSSTGSPELGLWHAIPQRVSAAVLQGRIDDSDERFEHSPLKKTEGLGSLG